MKELRNKSVNSVFGGVGIATLLCVLMVMMSWSAMVTNSDINSESAVNVDSPDAEMDMVGQESTIKEDTSFNPEIFGFDEDREMLGMRTENTKTFLNDEGKQVMVVSNQPLHITNRHGQLIDIDTSIKTWDHGYYAHDVHNPVTFGSQAFEGFSMVFGEDQIISGLDPMPVIVTQGDSFETQLTGILGEHTNEIQSMDLNAFTPSTKNVEVGGSSIEYPLAHGLDLQYHVQANKVKQDLVINELSSAAKEILQEVVNDPYDSVGFYNSKFGIMETMILPDNSELWADNHQITAADGVYGHPSMLQIVDSKSGTVFAYIDAPTAEDSSTVEKGQEVLDPNVEYFIQIAEDGRTVSIVTAVDITWLLDESTLFPVLIDPSLGANTETSLTAGVANGASGGYKTCDVATVDCFTRTDAYLNQDYGYQSSAPFFDFQFTQPTSLSVGSVTAHLSYNNLYYTHNQAYEFTPIQIMEDCGGSPPDGNIYNLNYFANQDGCTGQALPQHVPYTGTGGSYTPTTYEFSNRNYGMGYSWYCGAFMTSTCTQDQNGWGVGFDWIQGTGPEEQGGIFQGGRNYNFEVTDSGYNGRMSGGASFGVGTSPVGQNQWTTVYNTGTSYDGFTFSVNVPAGEEMRLEYTCTGYRGSGCYGYQNTLEVTPGAPPVLIPAAASGVGAQGAPTGSEAADVSFTIGTGKEAYMSFTSGSAVGDANEVVIYYRLAGTQGWTDSWDICSGTDCAPSTTYNSYAASTPIVFQQPTVYELLVWDTAGDGSGSGASGIVNFDDAGTNTGGVIANTPSGSRLVSLVSTEQIATFKMTSSPWSGAIPLCVSVSDCNSGAMAMFVDAYKNAGYIEFALGFSSGANSPYANGSSHDGDAYFDNFYLVVELEDTTPDATPPQVAYDGHYTGVTSYIQGARTLFLSILDTNNPVMTTSGATQLHYSTDGGNTYSAVDASLTTPCQVKNVVCSFKADTGELSPGTTVDYYWTFSDAAPVDTTKIPTQNPNPGRFPAAGSADLTFTIASVYDAPTDGTDMKLITYMDNIRHAEPHDGFVSSGDYAGDVDRQMTYYTSSGEYHFEFGLDNCGANFPGSGGVPGTDGQGNCFFDIDAYPYFGEDSGHWDINWEGVATDCTPGITGCNGAPTNNLELDAHFGGPLGITGLEGAGNLIMSFDEVNNAWMIAGAGTGIEEPLDASAQGVVAMPTFTSNIHTPTGPTPSSQLLSSGFSGSYYYYYYYYYYYGSTGSYSGPISFTINTGDVGRIVYECDDYCDEDGIAVVDTATNTVYDMGRNDGQAVYGSVCTQSGMNDYQTYYSDSFNPSSPACNTVGLLPAGSYQLYHYDSYGDGSDANVYVETIASPPGFAGGSTTPFETNEYDGRGSTWARAQSFVIDLNSVTTSLGPNDGFGGASLGTNTGEFNMICMTTAGHVMFLESTAPRCNPDATQTAAGGQWQGFALGAGENTFQYNGNGLIYQIREVQPDEDSTAPEIIGGGLGDSHALKRTVTATLSDNGLYDNGLNTNPTPGVGPSVHVTVTSEDGTVTTSVLAMQPDGTRNDCIEAACSWSADIDNLVRGDSVSYYITASDLYPPSPNQLTSATYDFEVANPTNTLIVEWHEYAYDIVAFANIEPCSMQVIMYDVTNEFEFHYDEDCYVDDIVGLQGIREDRQNTLQVRNDDTDRSYYYSSTGTDPGNPHANNIRFTLLDNGEYAYETFDLGINFLPLVSSNPTIPVGTSTFSNDDNCDSNSDFTRYALYCAGNFDIPDDFNFEFYGQNFDGSNPDNRIHVIGSGMLYFIDDGDQNTYRHETGWPAVGTMYDLDTTSNLFPDMMMAPWWSRETMDYCYGQPSTRVCEGVYHRTLPFDGQGKTVSADITEDTTWYAIDSPIKVNPTDASGYLSITANLTIEAGVDVIVAEGAGISFDGGLNANGDCTRLTAIGNGADRITFDSDKSFNSGALWDGLAFTDDCGGTGIANRHNFEMVDISNTNYAAITAGSRPGDASYPKCGTAQQDCDVGEFEMNDVTFSNVASAFSHGSGQGTLVTMNNFAVTDARDACFNFAENTVAVLTGTANNPSTMTRCNTNGNNWGGAIVNMPGSTAGSLTLRHVDIVDSEVSLIRTDLQMITISDVSATMTNGDVNPRVTGQGQWAYDNSGVHLGLSHGANSEVEITNFNAPDYTHGWVYAASKVVLDNVNLGTGFTNDHAFNINPYAGVVQSVPGSVGTDSVFDTVTVPEMTMFRTYPGTANAITVTGEFKIAEFGLGGYSDMIEFTGASVGGKFIVDGCGANVKMLSSTIGQLDALCYSAGDTNSVMMENSQISHSTTNSAAYLHQANVVLVDVTVSSQSISGNGPYIAFVDYGSDAFLIDVDFVDANGNTFPCADANGKTAECHTGAAAGPFVSGAPEIYYGGFANALAYRLGSDTSTTPPTPSQIPESGISVYATTLDSTGAEILPGRIIYQDTTGNDGRATRVAVITADINNNVYDSHKVVASGAAGVGEAHPDLVDGTPATEVQFIDGTLQTSVPLADFGTYTIGSYADIRLTAPPVTLNDSIMDCNWMLTNNTFQNALTGSGNYVFTQTELVLDGDLIVDGCNIELKGSELIFRQDPVNNPSLTISNGGSVTMTVDTLTGDTPKIYGEGNREAVDISIVAGGTLDMQGGSMKNFLLGGKTGQLVVGSGGLFSMSDAAYLTSSDLATAGLSDLPLIHADGGLVTTTGSVTLAGSSNLGIGVKLTDGGDLSGDGLTISDMKTGIDSIAGSISMDAYTSTGNTYGVVVEDGPKLPEMYTSATLQGFATNYPNQPYQGNYEQMPGMDNCYSYFNNPNYGHNIGCFEWKEYTVDLSSWIGQDSYLQPAMELTYDNSRQAPVRGWDTSWPSWVSLDNLYITVTDTSGNEYTINSENDPGYYPYSDNDPAVTTNGDTYLGGLGGTPSWDCNYLGVSYNPWRFGQQMESYGQYSQSVGDLYNTNGWGYPEEFAYRITPADSPNLAQGSWYPIFYWGYDDPVTGRVGPTTTGNGNGYTTSLTNPSTYHDTTIGETSPNGVYEVCSARAWSSTTRGMNMLLEWPTLDLTDPSIAKVELNFDMWHRYYGALMNYAQNNNRDSVQLVARSGEDPSAFGAYSQEVKGKGVTFTNSQIDGAYVGVDVKDEVIISMTNLVVNDPTGFGVRTSGNNNVVLDGLQVIDSTNSGNTNYGFYTESTVTGFQDIKNSAFSGLNTGVYLTNDLATSVVDTTFTNNGVGLRVGATSEANHDYNTLTFSGNDVGIKADGTGRLNMKDVDITSLTTDIQITGSNRIDFLDGSFDDTKLDISSTATGIIDRDRTYTAELQADGAPLVDANVVFSSRDAATSSSGSTNSNGVTEGLSFSVADYDSANGKTDYSNLYGTYTLSTVAMVSYSYTDATTNDADFRYITATPTLTDAPSDGATTNHDLLSLTDKIDVRVCGTNSDYVMVAPCAGGVTPQTPRTYTSGTHTMIEYGDNEDFQDGTDTLDLTGKAVMIDTGDLLLKDGVEYILDGATVFDTGYTTEYGTGVTEWKSEVPYDTTLTMTGGEISGLYSKTALGDSVGLIIGGLQGSFENALNIDFDGVTMNNIVGIATGAGDRTFSSTTGSANTYIPSIVEIENSFLNHFRGYFYTPQSYIDLDYCIRLSGTFSATISGNTFNDCIIGVALFDSDWNSAGTTTQAHEQIGSDNVVIDNNDFVSSSGYAIRAFAGADADFMQITNNEMTCSGCIHVRFDDDTSFAPTIEGNTFNGGDFAVYTDLTEKVVIEANTFNNQADAAIRAEQGDFDAIGNTINNPGNYGIMADSLEKPSEVIEIVVAGVNSPQPDDGVSFITWDTSCGGSGNGVATGGPACTSPDVTAVVAQGEEMIMRLHQAGRYVDELTVNYKDPNNVISVWDPVDEGDSSDKTGIILDIPGTYTFNLEDDYGDGANGGGFEVIKAEAGSFSVPVPNTNPAYYWDPGVSGIQTVKPPQYTYTGYPSGTSSAPTAYSNTMDGVIIQNPGPDDITYEFRGYDQYGDGFGSNCYTNIGGQTAPIGTWQTTNTGYPAPSSTNYGGPFGDWAFRIGCTSAAPLTVEFTDGEFSEPLFVTLEAGQELRFRLFCSTGCYEAVLQWQEAMPPSSVWVGPTIEDNTINFDSVDNNPNAVGMLLSNCNVASYAITTSSNNINIGQNAIVNNGCVWNDVDSVITGSNQVGSIGYNDDNSYGFDITLDGTTISGFETGLIKTGGGTLYLTGDATVAAGNNGVGVSADGINVVVEQATVDGGTNGIGMDIANSPYGWFYPMDVTGNIGVNAYNSEILWDAGEVDADTIIIAESVTGTIQSLTDPATGGGPGVASAASSTMIDARANTRLTVVNWALDETKMVVDSTSIVDESNWLSIDANHLGDEPVDAVGLSVISDLDYTAYSSPVFDAFMDVDGLADDWFGGNTLNPSGYAMPGHIGGPMYVTTESGDAVFGFNGVDTATNDVYIYIDSNDMAGTTSGYNSVHTLPYAVDYALILDSSGANLWYYNSPNWELKTTSGAVAVQGSSFLEASVPVSSLGNPDSMKIVATVQTGNVVSDVSPQQTIVGSGAETLTDAYTMELNKLDMADGTINDEVLKHRSFEFSSIPTTPHTYTVMVKTAAEARHTCDYDWATQSAVSMASSTSLSFDILRACPEITNELSDILVLEDSTSVTLDLATYVDDEQDTEADMVWDVTEVPLSMDAYDDILSDFSDSLGVTGTIDVTPINDQFGTFELKFDVVDSHGQTASKTITYTVLNVNDAPVICDARSGVDPTCENGDVNLYYDPGNPNANPPVEPRVNSRDEGFTSYTKPLGKVANDTVNSYIRDMANEQYPVNQVYTWGADADCDQISVSLQQNANLVDEIVIVENQNWEEGGICEITLTLSDDGAENADADPVTVYFEVAPVNDAPVIATQGVVTSADGLNSFQGLPDGNYRLDLVEDTTDPDMLTFDLSAIKSDIDHLNADLAWTLEPTNSCNSANYYTHSINGDTLEFTLIPDATTNAQPWEVDMLNNNGIHQTRTANGRCEMTLTLSDSEQPPSYMPNYTALTPNNYEQLTDSVTLSIEVDNVAENVPDYFLRESEGFDFNGVNNVMPGTMVPVDFSIHAGGDEGPYTYNHLLEVTLHSDGHDEIELPRYYNPPAYGESLDIDDWYVMITAQTTEVWVEVDVVTCNPGSVCTPENNDVQTDNPESHNAVSSSQAFGKWSEPGRIGEDETGSQSNRRPAFEDKNWCNNLMSSNGGVEVAWSDATSCGHSEQGYNGAFGEDWQTAGNALPVDVTTIGALSVASFAPSIIAVALTGLFVSALVLAGRRDDDDEDFVEEQMSDDESAVSPVIATILMVAITVVLSGVVYVWAAQLADTDTKGVPRVTFDATNVDTGNVATDHWKITVGQAQTVLATQAVEVRVIYADASGAIVTDTTNLASTNQVYGFSPFNSDQLVTFGDVVTLDEDETISSFSTGDDIYVKTHLADGTPLVDATIRIVYSPAGDTQGAVIKTYTGMTWNQPV